MANNKNNLLLFNNVDIILSTIISKSHVLFNCEKSEKTANSPQVN